MALPADPCNPKEQPPQTEDGPRISVSPRSLQPQNNWQREGREVDISIVGLTPVEGGQTVVCFGWKLEGGTPDEQAKLASFVRSPSVTREIPNAEKTTTAPQPTKFVATVPELGIARAHIEKDRKDVAVVRELNNTNPIAEVRFIIFDKSDKAAVLLKSKIGVTGAENFCDIPDLMATTDNVAKIDGHRSWQPLGGEFEFTVNTARPIPTDALVKICFRWKLKPGHNPGIFYDSGIPRVLDRQPRSVKIAARVPDKIENAPSWFSQVADNVVLGIAVPRADMRILIFDRDYSPVVAVVQPVGITSVFFALLMVAIVGGLAFFGLWWVCRKRLSALRKANACLCVITSRRGFASLSQFQIVLWTFVVLASSVYVMALSGDLIEITAGTLVLLGISGTSLVASKAKSERDAAREPTLDPVATRQAATLAQNEANRLRAKATQLTGDAKTEADAATQEAQAKADAAKATADAAEAVDAAMKKRAAAINATDSGLRQTAETDAVAAEAEADRKKQAMAIANANAVQTIQVRHPRWSDLVMEEVQGRELDVTRVQMIYFTLITAGFVLLTVATTFVIPEIPQGFLILMGISNGVYVGSKFVNNPDARS